MKAAVLVLVCVFNIEVVIPQAAIKDDENVEEVHVDNGCSKQIQNCQTAYKRLAYPGLPETVVSPDELETHCRSRDFTKCLETINVDLCYKQEVFDIAGAILAEDYVCSDKGKKQYKKENKYSAEPWMELKAWYMKDESRMCHEHFLEPTNEYFKKSEKYVAAAEALPDPKNVSKEEELLLKSKDEKEHYCNYMYSYQHCIESAAMRHANDTISTWQYEVVSQYYTPHFIYMDCHIGKGLKQITINAIIIVTVILCGIFGLALFCGVYEKCGERLSACRRSKSSSLEDLTCEKGRESVLIPDNKTGMPQRTGSRVRFDDMA